MLLEGALLQGAVTHATERPERSSEFKYTERRRELV